MTDLDQLKQELYKKIKETEQPDPVPTRKDLLKYSHKRPNQPDDHWKESIAQARIPASSSNEALSQVAEYLQNALNSLDKAQAGMANRQLNSQYSQLYTAICNAIHESNTALKHISDSPDE